MSQALVLDGMQAIFAVGTSNKHVCRAVVGAGGLDHVHPGGDSHHDVALAGLERIADEAAPLRPPSVGYALAKLARDELGEPVFEALALAIGEGEIVRISADTKSIAGALSAALTGHRREGRCGED